MDAEDRASLVRIAVTLVLGGLIVAAGSDESADVGGVPVFAVCGAVAFVVNWVAFVPAYARRTEQFYDLTGSITYLSVMALALIASPDLDARAWISGLLVGLWAARLGSFLFRRIRRDGGDGRFDDIKIHPLRFLATWSIQALWVLITGSAALAAVTAENREPLGIIGIVGIALWVVGFGIEVLADTQKSAFRADPANQGRFITTGIWAWSRHPNYFGEIVLWLGVAVLAVPVLEGFRWAVLISPVFVYLLLTRVSGVPLLEARGKARWGDDPEYQRYKERTPVLVPRPPG